MDEKPNPIKEAQIAAKKAAAELKLKRAELVKHVGKTIGDAKVTGFEPDKNLGGKAADAFIVNYGNPNRHDYVHCDELLNNKGKE